MGSSFTYAGVPIVLALGAMAWLAVPCMWVLGVAQSARQAGIEDVASSRLRVLPVAWIVFALLFIFCAPAIGAFFGPRAALTVGAVMLVVFVVSEVLAVSWARRLRRVAESRGVWLTMFPNADPKAAPRTRDQDRDLARIAIIGFVVLVLAALAMPAIAQWVTRR